MLWTTRPLAWSFVATTDPDFWGPIFHYLALTTELLRVRTDAALHACTASTGVGCRRTGGSTCSASAS